ncbi:hypothetical protein JCM10450v2_008178 [Rhodotorula kratochvilovae]
MAEEAQQGTLADSLHERVREKYGSYLAQQSGYTAATTVEGAVETVFTALRTVAELREPFPTLEKKRKLAPDVAAEASKPLAQRSALALPPEVILPAPPAS